MKGHIIILSAATGGGHTQAARAMSLAAEQAGYTARIIELEEIARPWIRTAYLDPYEWLVRHPAVWKALYVGSNWRGMRQLCRPGIMRMWRREIARLASIIKEEEPVAILSTHFLAAHLAAATGLLDAMPHGVVLTDYSWHEMFYVGSSWQYFVASNEMVAALKGRGIPASQIHLTGIPIRPQFYEYKDREELRKRYHISDSQPCYLLIGGGEGMIDLGRVVDKVVQVGPATVIAIAGSNTALEEALSQKNVVEAIDYRVIGWTDAIDEYMRIADVVISKPGGLTTTECVELGCPLVAVYPIPGQEEGNARYLESEQYGVWVRDIRDLRQVLQQPLSIKKKPAQVPAGEEIIRVLISSSR